MRAFLVVFSLALLVMPATAAAQSGERPKPKDLEKIDDVPPPPQVIVDPAVEPQMSIKTRDGERVEEFRVNGKLYKMRVVPRNGAPYWLIDPKGDGNFVRSDTDLVPRNAVPMWVIFQW